MNYQIDKNTRTPAYMQLYHLLRKDITEQVYAYGEKLPSKRIIAAETGTSVITAEHALSILCEEGYVEARERSGYFCIYRDAGLRGDGLPAYPSGPAVLHMFHADSRPREEVKFPFTVLSRTMRKVLSDLGEQILEKSPGYGLDFLRQEICAYLARSRGIHTRPEQVVIGSGAEYLYGLIAQLLRDYKEFALEDPSYNKIRKVYESFGIRCDMLKLAKDGIRSDMLARTKAGVLHVTPFHSYPSGITADISKKQEYLTWAKQRDGYIVEDNYDSELTVSRKQEDPLFSMAGGENVIYLNTFTKTIAPSIRAGYLILPERLLDSFREKLGFYSCTVPVFEQYVLAELIRNGDYERHVNRIRRARRKRESMLP